MQQNNVPLGIYERLITAIREQAGIYDVSGLVSMFAEINGIELDDVYKGVSSLDAEILSIIKASKEHHSYDSRLDRLINDARGKTPEEVKSDIPNQKNYPKKCVISSRLFL